MRLTAQPMQNDHVRLSPLAEAHREDLREACAADTRIWTELYPISWAGEQFDLQWSQYMAAAAKGRLIPMAVLAHGRCVGLTCFMTLDPDNAAVEIGGTYYRPEVRGEAVNPAAKRLMMGRAFDEAGARRVVFRVDALNLRSRAAVLKLGAVQEGILRQDRVVWTGRIRDTVVFSVLADEWPAVRDRLDARLAGLGS